MSDILYPLYRDPIFSNAKKFVDYEKLKNMHKSISSMINQLSERVETHGKPRNPRQDFLQNSDKLKLRSLQQRKTHIEEKMVALENTIKTDIDKFNAS